MHTHEIIIEYSEPRTTTITIDTPDEISSLEIEDLALAQFEEQYPDAMDVDIVEVRENI